MVLREFIVGWLRRARFGVADKGRINHTHKKLLRCGARVTRAENCLAATSRQETRHARSRVLTVDKSRERWALDYATDYDRVPICARKQTARAKYRCIKHVEWFNYVV